VCLHYGLDNGQPEANTSLVGIGCSLATLERFEQPDAIAGLQAAPTIGYDRPDLVITAGDPDSDPCIAIAVLAGVSHQVYEYLSNPAPIRRHKRQIGVRR